MLPRRVTGTACEAANVTPLIAFKRIGRTPSRSPLAMCRVEGLRGFIMMMTTVLMVLIMMRSCKWCELREEHDDDSLTIMVMIAGKPSLSLLSFMAAALSTEGYTSNHKPH